MKALKLGQTITRKLHSVGIRTAGELIETGSKEAVIPIRIKSDTLSTSPRRAIALSSARLRVSLLMRIGIRRLKAEYPSTCVVILYHLQAAIEGVEMKMLSPETKADLKQFFKQLQNDVR